ncbi:sporulation-delaying protein SdpB family protein [Pedobacter cryoconitis]|nr:sporulation-delaying protein SdpB family protein [Pedobacter cryoconitis]
MLALGTFLTLIFNSSDLLFPQIIQRDVFLVNTLYYKANFFQLFSSHPEIGRWMAIFFLGIIIIGWRPRYSSFFHFWITTSFMFYTTTPDGGDQVSGVLSLFFFPIGLFDNRKWHWSKSIISKSTKKFYSKSFCFSLILIIKVQIAIIYLNAATAKFNVFEWVNGTALWYWLKDPIFGSNYWFSFIVLPLLKSPIIISLITWGSVILELFLFMALVMSKQNKQRMLVLGILFHLAIGVIQGLGSFFFAMASALIIYLKPIDNEFDFSSVVNLKIWLIKKRIVFFDLFTKQRAL